jgi:hypothetical protein
LHLTLSGSCVILESCYPIIEQGQMVEVPIIKPQVDSIISKIHYILPRITQYPSQRPAKWTR